MLLSLLTLSSLLFITTEAAECTDAESATAESIWVSAAQTSACAPYVTQTSPVFVNAPCSATACVAVVEGVAKDLPDCTFNGINNKIEVQNALTSCNGGATADAGSLTAATDAPQGTTATDSSTTASSASTSSSSALTPVSTTSTTSCTTSEIKTLWKAYVDAATSDECSSESVINEESIQILADCGSKCIDAIGNLAYELPNCSYDYESLNKKQEVLDAFKGCDGSASSVTLTVTPDPTVDLSSSTGSEVSAPEMSSSSSSSSSSSGSVVAGSNDMSGSNQLRSGDQPSNQATDSSTGGSGSNASPARTDELQLWISLLTGMIVFFLS
ncbi:hypothetical protein P3T76_002440 [Phytophthora citrophthora]|uniref:Elicitin-like protein n=1 Tax=Phytophthora citrophthora TaxID=4793 RepID=A0AAD9GZ22_9STRA|nr:hypothetical protein P3T76_002440 [Phytophthora citrophthora]